MEKSEIYVLSNKNVDKTKILYPLHIKLYFFSLKIGTRSL